MQRESESNGVAIVLGVLLLLVIGATVLIGFVLLRQRQAALMQVRAEQESRMAQEAERLLLEIREQHDATHDAVELSSEVEVLRSQLDLARQEAMQSMDELKRQVDLATAEQAIQNQRIVELVQENERLKSQLLEQQN